jgi:hypothetical protein
MSKVDLQKMLINPKRERIRKMHRIKKTRMGIRFLLNQRIVKKDGNIIFQ